MPTTAVAIRAALEQRIIDTAPTERTDVAFKKLSGDDLPDDVSRTSGMLRRFYVDYVEGEDMVDMVQTFTEDQINERFLVAVLYPLKRDRRALGDLMRSDLHDLRVAINRFDLWRSLIATGDQTALLHAHVPRWTWQRQDDNDLMVLAFTVDVQFLEATT